MFNLEAGTSFPTVKEAKQYLNEYSKFHQRRHRVLRSSSTYYQVACATSECPFNVRFNRRADGSFYLISFANHNCPEVKFNAKRDSMKDNVKTLFDNVDNLKPKDCIALLRGVYGINASYHSAWRSLKDLKTNPILHSYSRLESFLSWNSTNNPGTIVDIQKTHDVLNSCFLCLNISINMFKVCLPIIELQSVSFISNRNYMALSVTSFDGENKPHTIAMAIVRADDDTKWTYFLRQLESSLALSSKKNLIVLCAREDLLQDSVKEILPNAAISYCISSLDKELKANFSQNIKSLLLRAAQASTREEFDVALAQISTKSKEAHDHLAAIPHENWAHYTFPFYRYGNLSLGPSPFIESQKSHPFECLYQYVNNVGQSFSDQAEPILKSDLPFTNWFASKIAKSVFESQDLTVFKTMEPNSFRVGKDQTNLTFKIVNLSDVSCTCNIPKNEGLPCQHLIAAIHYSQNELKDYINDCFQMDQVKEVYKTIFHFCDIENLEQNNLVAREPLRKRGRCPKEEDASENEIPLKEIKNEGE